MKFARKLSCLAGWNGRISFGIERTSKCSTRFSSANRERKTRGSLGRFLERLRLLDTLPASGGVQSFPNVDAPLGVEPEFG